MRAAAVVAAGAALALGVVASGVAQQSPPTVPITASESTLTVGAPGPLAAGPTRFELSRAGGGDLDIGIAALRPGVTAEEALTALRSPRPEDVLDLIHLDAGLTLPQGQQRRAVTVELRPNATYFVVNATGDRSADWEIQGFTVGAPGTAAAPRPDARLRMVDLRFRGDATLPLNGVVRVENAGYAPHFAVAFPLRRGASAQAVGRALRRDDQRRLGRLVDVRSAVEVQSLITRGAVNYNEVRFPRRGRYALACFFSGHHMQGMYRFVRVR
jgi:hypothetical protein